MGDHYRILGVTTQATKEEIKEAFRKLAIQFHPDKHAQSSKSVRDAATLKFKQVSHAYEILSDDRKRAAYNLSRSNPNYSASYGYNYNSANYNNTNYNYSYARHSHRATSSRSRPWADNLNAAFRYMTTREFLRSLVFASLLLAGTVAVDMSGDTLWKMHNTGKSFEEAMKSVHNRTPDRDKE